MEPVTQALLGAATGHLVAGKALGRPALVFGALVGMAPDIDVVFSGLHRGFGEWLYHRGTSHSLWFGFVAGPLLGLGLRNWRDPRRQTPLSAWISLCVIALVTHPLLDGFTAYGTQFFAPFSRLRFAWNGVSIVDPIYSILLGAGVVFAATSTGSVARAQRGLALGLILSSVYLTAGLGVNHWVVRDLERVFALEGAPASRIRAYPTIFQPWLRHFVVHVERRRYVGFYSLMDLDCPSWRVHEVPLSNPRIDKTLASWEGALFTWFADGDISIEERVMPFGSSVFLEDLRYAWSSSDAQGMWGIEARFDTDGAFFGPIRRISRASPRDRDLSRLVRVMSGELPTAAEGWSRPATCSQTEHIAGRTLEPDAALVHRPPAERMP